MDNDTRQLITDKLDAHVARIESAFALIEYKLDKITIQVEKTNGRVTKLEDNDKLHYFKCPNTNDISKLNDLVKENKAIKKWLITTIGIAATLITIAYNYFKLQNGL